MKIIIINGSPRTKGFTSGILREMEKSLEEKKVRVEYVDLSRIEMSYCQGCCVCYKIGKCHLDDDAEKLSTKIKEADGVVLGSPTYASNVSGHMKTFIDRGHFVIEQLLKDKYCVTVATGENYGNKDAAKVLNNLVLYSGGCLVKSVTVKAPFNGYKKEDVHKTAEAAAEQLYQAVIHKRKKVVQLIYHKIIFELGIKPFVKRKGSFYKGVTDKWKELGIQ